MGNIYLWMFYSNLFDNNLITSYKNNPHSIEGLHKNQANIIWMSALIVWHDGNYWVGCAILCEQRTIATSRLARWVSAYVSCVTAVNCVRTWADELWSAVTNEGTHPISYMWLLLIDCCVTTKCRVEWKEDIKSSKPFEGTMWESLGQVMTHSNNRWYSGQGRGGRRGGGEVPRGGRAIAVTF